MSDRMHCIPFRALLDWVLGEWEESGCLSDSGRGAGGFGSTGVK